MFYIYYTKLLYLLAMHPSHLQTVTSSVELILIIIIGGPQLWSQGGMGENGYLCHWIGI